MVSVVLALPGSITRQVSIDENQSKNGAFTGDQCADDGQLVAYGLGKLSLIGGEIEEVAEEDIPLIELLSMVTIGQLEQSIAMERALRAGGVPDHGGMAMVQKMGQQFDSYNVTIADALHKGEKLAQQGIKIAHNDASKQKVRVVPVGL